MAEFRPERRPRRRWLWRGLLVLAGVPVVAVAVVAFLGFWTVPPDRAMARIPGLGARVDITLDAYGIPRIVAASEADAAMALGWLHARDRLFQMESLRRGASGRLAELGGESVLRLDRYVRTLGLARRAVVDFAALPADTRAILTAYAAGVNARIAERRRLAAPEFLALGAPEPWKPQDSLLWAKVMGLWLSGNWRVELARARLAPLLPPDRLEELWPADRSLGRPDLALAGIANQTLAGLPTWPEPGTHPGSASNSWAVGATRSTSGAPLLANDPHLGFQAPILWYLARIELPGGRFLAGATSPGVPFMVIGRNEKLAWGFTTTHSDSQDVFVERLAGPDAYETPDGPRPFIVTEETIAVRGAEPVTLRVRETRHGPVVSDLGERLPDDNGTVLAVAMANLAMPDLAAAGLHALNRAGTLAEARAAAARITTPPQNLMVAAADGGIAMYLTGRVPVRAGGDGSVPARGWDGSQDWTGWVPFDALPHIEAPASGVLVNANNRVAPPDSPVFLGRDWFGDWRFRRIGALLGARARHDMLSMGAIQRDVRSLLAEELLLAPGAPLATLPRPPGPAGQAFALLRDWDGEIAADRPQPLIWNAWLAAIDRAAMRQAGIPEGAWEGGPRFMKFLFEPGDRAAWWCGGDCRVLAATALRDAVTTLAAAHGPDPAAWRWGAVHVARFEHPLLRFVPLLRDAARLEAATGGDEVTVDRGSLDRRLAHVHGAGLRLVADLASPDGLAAVIATGQSGHPLSTHWGDFLPVWRDGGLVPLGAVPARITGRIALSP